MGSPFASTTHEGFDPEGANLKVMGGIMALGAIVDGSTITSSMRG